MMRRLYAWALLILFVLLLINIMIVKIYMAESVGLYGLMIAMFFFTRIFGRGGSNDEPKEGEPNEGNEESEDDEDGKSEQGTGDN